MREALVLIAHGPLAFTIAVGALAVAAGVLDHAARGVPLAASVVEALAATAQPFSTLLLLVACRHSCQGWRSLATLREQGLTLIRSCTAFGGGLALLGAALGSLSHAMPIEAALAADSPSGAASVAVMAQWVAPLAILTFTPLCFALPLMAFKGVPLGAALRLSQRAAGMLAGTGLREAAAITLALTALDASIWLLTSSMVLFHSLYYCAWRDIFGEPGRRVPQTVSSGNGRLTTASG